MKRSRLAYGIVMMLMCLRRWLEINNANARGRTSGKISTILVRNLNEVRRHSSPHASQNAAILHRRRGCIWRPT